MRALVLVACLASSSALAADDSPPALELEAHYGVMYAGRTFVHVDIRGLYDDAKRSLEPNLYLQITSTGPCTDYDCGSRSSAVSWTDARTLVDALTQAQTHLAAGTDMDRWEDERLQGCAMGSSFRVVVDGKTKRMRLSFNKSADAQTAVFDPDEVDYLLGMVRPASARLLKLSKQFAAFNDAARDGTPLDKVKIMSPCDPRVRDE